MRVPIIVISLLLSGCLSNTSDLDVEPSFNTAIELNGFWEGQFNQGGAVRFLFYDGEIYGTDGSSGYRGSLSYNDSEQSVSMSMKVLGLTTVEDSGDYIVAGGDSFLRSFSGLLINQLSETNSIVGNYTQTTEGGSLSVTTDGTWQNGSALWQLLGTWKTDSYQLNVGQSGNNNVFFGESASGCTFKGDIYLLNDRYPLFEVNMYERSNCTGMNLTTGQSAQGYTAINGRGELEMYVVLNDELLVMTFSK